MLEEPLIISLLQLKDYDEEGVLEEAVTISLLQLKDYGEEGVLEELVTISLLQLSDYSEEGVLGKGCKLNHSHTSVIAVKSECRERLYGHHSYILAGSGQSNHWEALSGDLKLVALPGDFSAGCSYSGD